MYQTYFTKVVTIYITLWFQHCYLSKDAVAEGITTPAGDIAPVSWIPIRKKNASQIVKILCDKTKMNLT